MGIFDGIIFCHYAEAREKFYSKAINESKYNIYRITDEEMIVMDNKNIVVI